MNQPRWLPLALPALALAAVIHLWLIPSELTESGPMAVAFAMYAAAALVAAVCLTRRPDSTAWRLAGLIGVVGVLAFVLSRLGALPGACPDDPGDWANPYGMSAGSAEAIVAVLAMPALRGWLSASRRVAAAVGVIAVAVLPAPAFGSTVHPTTSAHHHHGASDSLTAHDHSNDPTGHDQSEGLSLVGAGIDKGLTTHPKPCTADAPVRSFDVHAINVDITVNRFGDHDPHGRMYVLGGDIPRVRAEEAANARARATRQPAHVSTGLQDDAIQPLTLRVQPGDCLRLHFTNDLPDSVASIDVHGSSMRVLGTQLPAIASTKRATVGPQKSVSYEWAIPTDEPQGTHYFNSNQRELSAHGLFGAVIVEPAGSRWLDPTTGKPIETGWQGVVVTPNQPAFREFALYYHEIGDETYQLLAADGTLVPLAETLAGSYRPAARAINYRSEPFYDRLKLQKELLGRADVSLPYSSYTFGDPATPMMRSYVGDPIVQRVIDAGTETAHVHHVHGGAIRWRRLPGEGPTDFATGLQKHPPLTPGKSERTDSQTIGPSETFDVYNECGSGGCQQAAGDFMYHCHIAHHYFAGMWGIWRVYNTLQDGTHSTDTLPPLLPLPDRTNAVHAAVDSAHLVGHVVDGVSLTAASLTTWLRAHLPPAGVPDGYDASVWDWQLDGLTARGEADDSRSWVNYRSRTPGQRPAILFDPVTGKPAYPLLHPHFGKRPPFAPGHGPAPYLDPSTSRSVPLPGADGPTSLCPAGTRLRSLHIKAIDVPIPQNGRENVIDPQGKLFVLQQDEAAVRRDPDLRRPLTIRANAGQDCIDVTLTDGMRDAKDPNNFSKVSMHIHFVQFDVQGSDGVDTGFNYEQTVRSYADTGKSLADAAPAGATVLHVAGHYAPGSLIGVGMDRADGFEVAQVRAAVGNVVVLAQPLRQAHAAGEIVSTEFVRYRWYPDTQFGTAFFHDHVNAINGQPHGLYGALVVEPPGSTYHDPITGATISDGPLADVHTTNPVSVDVRGSFRELVTYLADDNPLTSVGDDTGGVINLRSEPLDSRPDPSQPFRGSALATPQISAYVGDPVVFRALVGASNEVHTFHIDGHAFRTELWSSNSPPTSTVPIGISERYDVVVPAAGGPRAQPGDYLFMNGRLSKLAGGSWGVLHVLPGPASVRLQPLPGHDPTRSSAPPVCPTNAPRVNATISAVHTTLPMLGGPGLVFIGSRDAAAVSSGRSVARPLVLYAHTGDCINVSLQNETDQRISLHADLLAAPAGTAAVGANPDDSVTPRSTRSYQFYAAPEFGTGVAMLRDGVNPTNTLPLGLYGAVVIAPAGARITPTSGGAIVHPVNAPAYRDFTLFMQDGDDSIGTHRMPYRKDVNGVAAINYGATASGMSVAPPVLSAYAGDRVVLHVLAPASEQPQVFGVEGHTWPVESGTPGTSQISAVTIGGMQALTMTLEGGAGGPEHLVGDFRYGDLRGPYYDAGMWGVLRVHPPGTQVPGLRPVTGTQTFNWWAVAVVGGVVFCGVVLAVLTRRNKRAAE